MASREHMKNMVPVFSIALKEADTQLNEIDAIAFTNGPGLLGPLMVGNSFAKGLFLSTRIPMIQVNHMEAHVLAHFIDGKDPELPFLCLTVSGGHTQLVLVEDDLSMRILGKTLDDAGGEAFDKIGKMLGLEYPAGPQIDKLAKRGNSKAFDFPRIEMEDYDYSFSGLKTNVLYFLREELKKDPDFISKNLDDLSASIQKTIIDTLLIKLEKAANDLNVNSIGIAGGVAANSGLQNAVNELGKSLGFSSYVLPIEYCTDNAAMIAKVGEVKYKRSEFSDLDVIPSPRLSI